MITRGQHCHISCCIASNRVEHIDFDIVLFEVVHGGTDETTVKVVRTPQDVVGRDDEMETRASVVEGLEDKENRATQKTDAVCSTVIFIVESNVNPDEQRILVVWATQRNKNKNRPSVMKRNAR